MKKLLDYLNQLDPKSRAEFCKGAGTSEQYLRKACSLRQQMGPQLCINIERASNRAVLCEDVRPEVEWKYLRQTARRKK